MEDYPVWLFVLFFVLFYAEGGRKKQKSVYTTGNGYEQDFWRRFGAQVALALSTIQSVQA